MTSQLNVDTIVDKQGTGGPTVQSPTLTEMNSASTYVSEGGAVSQNTVQGLVKSYMAANGQGTIAVRGSFNATSLTDHGTGEYQYSFVNNMQNNEYVPSTSCQWDQNDDNKLAFSSVRKAGSSLETNQLGIGAANTSTTLLDVLRFFGQVVGDLA